MVGVNMAEVETSMASSLPGVEQRYRKVVAIKQATARKMRAVKWEKMERDRQGKQKKLKAWRCLSNRGGWRGPEAGAAVRGHAKKGQRTRSNVLICCPLGYDITSQTILRESHCVATPTGVVNEHTTREYVALAPLEQLVQDILQVLRLWQERN
jgi:hypothetical protein